MKFQYVFYNYKLFLIFFFNRTIFFCCDDSHILSLKVFMIDFSKLQSTCHHVYTYRSYIHIYMIRNRVRIRIYSMRNIRIFERELYYFDKIIQN